MPDLMKQTLLHGYGYGYETIESYKSLKIIHQGFKISKMADLNLNFIPDDHDRTIEVGHCNQLFRY